MQAPALQNHNPPEEEKPRRLVLHESDYEVIHLVLRYVFIQTRDIIRLTGRSAGAIRRRLAQLKTHGVLDRHTLHREAVQPIDAPPNDFVYSLGPRGVREAKRKNFKELPEHLRYSPDKTNRYLDHDIMMSRFHLSFDEGVEGTGHEITFWEQREYYMMDTFTATAGKRVTAKPDAFFGIDGKWYFFIEIAHTGESNYKDGESNIVRKIRVFDEYAKGSFQEKWGLENFRYILVMPTEEQKGNILVKLRKVGFASPRFWVTTEEDFQWNPLGKVFHSPYDFDKQSYSFFH